MLSKMGGRDTLVLGVASGCGAANPGCEDGPEVLRTRRFLDDPERSQPGFRWDKAIRPRHSAHGSDGALGAVADIAGQLAERAGALVREVRFPLVIGGDHSCAIGTWSGVRRALGEEARLGLIWIDAHMDSHTFSSSPSQHIHGMPLACLLGVGDPRLTGIAGVGAKLQPQDVCLIGVRSFEAEEAELLSKLGVRVFFMDEIRRRGLHEVFREALALVRQRTSGYGISIDLDVLDPIEEPGVGTPVPGGLLLAELSATLRLAQGDDKLLALEIVEYNPHLDPHFATARAIHDLCQSLLPCPP